MRGGADLHVHTTASDGTDTPERVVQLAWETGLETVAITDHDTVSGVAEAQAAGVRLGVAVMPGIEISSDYRGTDTHILGYLVDVHSQDLKKALDWMACQRQARNRESVERMARAGYPISMEELQAAFPGTVLGKPHVAQLLLDKGAKGTVGTIIRDLLNRGSPFYVPRARLPLEEAVGVIRSAGGVAVLAHPLQYGYDDPALTQLMDAGRRAGIQGMECLYSGYSPVQQEWLCGEARRRGWVVTGGSDYHGTRKPWILGRGDGALRVPNSCAAQVRRVWKEQNKYFECDS